jgi:hypothetical protein
MKKEKRGEQVGLLSRAFRRPGASWCHGVLLKSPDL